ncbi:hypothetical protein PJ985_11390 [Streptomyces sp. ACA25]|uniref:hypothetical protein n=1 Tax=Streptomyces sp. ACA25 TaxID=3022596 RepID=UPI00230739C8|nr:hypothetical protein [Streptomyces sp. ACA25]MDB1088168.1 hypothetical protein [Streptomyces sp. ACA25]
MQLRTRTVGAIAAAAALMSVTACGGSGGALQEALASGAAEKSADQEDNGEAENGAEDTEDTEDTDGADDAEVPELAEREASEIAELALDALHAVDSVRISGSGTTDDGELDMDLHIDREGNCAGELGFVEQGSFEIIVSGDQVWMKPDADFWRYSVGGAEGELAAQELDGKYMYGTTDDPELAGAAEMCDLDALLAEFDLSTSGNRMSKGPETVHRGTPVITVVEKPYIGEEATMLVATDGEPYPLYLGAPSAEDSFELEFSDFNEPVEIDPPPARSIIEV